MFLLTSHEKTPAALAAGVCFILRAYSHSTTQKSLTRKRKAKVKVIIGRVHSIVFHGPVLLCCVILCVIIAPSSALVNRFFQKNRGSVEPVLSSLFEISPSSSLFFARAQPRFSTVHSASPALRIANVFSRFGRPPRSLLTPVSKASGSLQTPLPAWLCPSATRDRIERCCPQAHTARNSFSIHIP